MSLWESLHVHVNMLRHVMLVCLPPAAVAAAAAEADRVSERETSPCRQHVIRVNRTQELGHLCHACVSSQSGALVQADSKSCVQTSAGVPLSVRFLTQGVGCLH